MYRRLAGKLQPGIQLSLLAALVLALYFPHLGNPLVFDSRVWFSPDNLRLLGSAESADRLLSKSLTLWLYHLSEGQFPYLRAVSLALHIAISCLLYQVFRRMLACAPGATSAAMFGTALFALHPMNVYAVAYLGQQELLLATFFAVLFLLAYQQALLRGRDFYFLLAAAFYLCAMLSKESVVMAPAVAAAMTLMHARLSTALLRRLWLPYCLYGAIAIYFTLMESENVGQVYEPLLTTFLPADFVSERLGDSQTYHARSIATQCAVFFRYLASMFLPLPDRMSIDLQLPLSEPITMLRSLVWPVAFLAYLSACGILILRGRGSALLGFCLAWPGLFYATELVAIRISEIFVIYRSYLWLPGPCLAAGLLLSRASPRLLLAVAAIIAFALSMITKDRLDTFADSYALWNEAVTKNRAHEAEALAAFRAYLNRGQALAERGDDSGAIEDYDRALELSGGSGLVHMNRGVSRARLGATSQALDDFDQAVALSDRYPDPLRAQIFANRANALAVLGRRDEALSDIERALQFKPDDPAYRDYRDRMLMLR